MPFYFQDYIDLVIKSYQHMRNTDQLSQLLVQPTTANIKQECLNVYSERIKKGEKVEVNTLRAFGVADGNNFRDLINDCPLDKFRPLRNLMNGKIKNPAQVNVELLAWLIDFKPRPFSHAQQVLRDRTGTDIPYAFPIDIKPIVTNVPPEQPGESRTEETVSDSKKESTANPWMDIENSTPGAAYLNGGSITEKNLYGKSLNRKLKMSAVIILIVVIIFGGIYMVQQYLNTRCMYWADDHYEQVNCDEKPISGRPIPLNKKTMKYLRMITRKDTITEWSIGKLYYISDDNIIKYYTSAGDYPDDLNRPLRKLTRIIFDKDSINRIR